MIEKRAHGRCPLWQCRSTAPFSNASTFVPRAVGAPFNLINQHVFLLTKLSRAGCVKPQSWPSACFLQFLGNPSEPVPPPAASALVGRNDEGRCCVRNAAVSAIDLTITQTGLPAAMAALAIFSVVPAIAARPATAHPLPRKDRHAPTKTPSRPSTVTMSSMTHPEPRDLRSLRSQ